MDSPVMIVTRLLLGIASKEDVQSLRDIKWLTPDLEKLYRVEIQKCLNKEEG